jgi:hypothetical protein
MSNSLRLLPPSEEERRVSEFALKNLRLQFRYKDPVSVEIAPGCFCKGTRERHIFPYSKAPKAEALRNFIGGAVLREHPLNLDKKDHIMADGTHRIFWFDHQLFSRPPLSYVVGQPAREITKKAAEDLTKLAESLFFSPKQKQLEFWPREINYDGFILLADVKRESDGTRFVKLNSSCLLALEAATALFKGNKEAQGFIDLYQEEKKPKPPAESEICFKKYSLPLEKPKIYFVDNKTREIFKVGDADREHLWGDHGIYHIIPDLSVGGDLTLERSDKGFHGNLFLIATKLETLPNHKGCGSDLCLEDLDTIKHLVDSHQSSLVGALVHVNLSGRTSFGIPILSLVWRPQGAYTAAECPLCNPLNKLTL